MMTEDLVGQAPTRLSFGLDFGIAFFRYYRIRIGAKLAEWLCHCERPGSSAVGCGRRACRDIWLAILAGKDHHVGRVSLARRGGRVPSGSVVALGMLGLFFEAGSIMTPCVGINCRFPAGHIYYLEFRGLHGHGGGGTGGLDLRSSLPLLGRFRSFRFRSGLLLGVRTWIRQLQP